MLRLGMIVFACCAIMTPTLANDAKFKAMLKALDPETRLEAACDAAAMSQIGKDANPFKPDRAMIGALSTPIVQGDIVQGTGGAFRSRGKWYVFSFTCQAAPDRLSIQSFAYRIGDPIPENKWDDYGLWR